MMRASKGWTRGELHPAAVFFALTVVATAWASTTSFSYTALVNLRTWVLVPSLVLLSALICATGAGRSIAVAIVLAITAAAYSWLMLSVNALTGEGAFLPHVTWVLINAALLSAFFAAKAPTPVIPELTAWWFVAYAALIALYTLVSGGLDLNYPPRFVYGIETVEGTTISYSQGISKFYGLAALLAALLYSPGETFSRRALCVLAMVCFLSLSLLGGGRGDFIVAAFLSLLAIGPRWALSLLVLVVLSAMMIGVSSYLMDDSNLYFRYEALLYSRGLRDVLFSQGAQLLVDRQSCAVIGCGIGFFQDYYGYPTGMHPHNALIESLISFGAPLSLLVISFAARGAWVVYQREGARSKFLFATVYFLLIGMKSGGLLLSWFLTSTSMYLALVGFRSTRLALGNSGSRKFV